MRRSLGLKEGYTGGVRIATVWPLGPSAGKLRTDDVLLAVDGVEIGQDATVPLRNNERINFLHLVTRQKSLDTVTVKVAREGRDEEVKIELRPDRWVVPRMDGYDAAPEYFIVGGLVFVPLSHPWAELKGKEQHARVLIHQHWGRALPEEGRQVVILTKVLAHPCNVGFHSLSNIVLDSFNGIPVRNVAQLAQAVASCESSSLAFELLRPAGDGKELVVLDRDACNEAQPQILAQHLIAVACMVRQEGCTELQPFAVSANVGLAPRNASTTEPGTQPQDAASTVSASVRG